MPVHKIDPLVFTSPTNWSMGIWTDSSRRLSLDGAAVRAALTGSARNDPIQIAAKATQLLQAMLDVRQPRTGLPADDPDKTVNPSRPNLFWDGLDLVGRGVKATITWTGTTLKLDLEALN